MSISSHIRTICITSAAAAAAISTSLIASAAVADIGKSEDAKAELKTATKEMAKSHEMHKMHDEMGHMNHKAPHMIVTQSQNDFATTLSKLQAAIETREFKTFAVIDHAAGAANVDLDLRPTTLIIFGNPKGGAPLMQAAQSVGIALPLRALVYETEDGTVKIATTDIKHVLHEHAIKDKDPLAEKISGVLKAISDEAAAL